MASAPYVTIGSLAASAAHARGAVVAIDVFRAFTTAAVALRNGAEAIVMVGDLETALKLRAQDVGSRCIGERGGERPDGFDFGNSPSEIRSVSFAGETLIQTTSNGTRVVRAAAGATQLFAASLVNAEATAKAILSGGFHEIWLIACGDGERRTEEDELCALYIRALIQGRSPDREAVSRAIAALSPRTDGGTLSAEDLAMCLDANSIPLAIPVERQGALSIGRPMVHQDRQPMR
jgi:2-phosphosulfolactate phosphatase